MKYAHDLGLAFQLTNIIRDVGEDARRNRIYLPLDELERFGVSEADILDSHESAEFQRLMAFQIERAKHYYAQAFAALPQADRKIAAPRPDHGRHLPHPAGRNRGRRLPRAESAHLPAAAAQAVDRLAHLAEELMRVAVIGGGYAGLGRQRVTNWPHSRHPRHAVRSRQDTWAAGRAAWIIAASRWTTASTFCSAPTAKPCA